MIRREALIKDTILNFLKEQRICVAQRIWGILVFRLGTKLTLQFAWAMAEEIEKKCLAE